jgi:hypothetical protein
MTVLVVAAPNGRGRERKLSPTLDGRPSSIGERHAANQPRFAEPPCDGRRTSTARSGVIRNSGGRSVN